MKSYRYVLLDPTGNLTALVLEPVEPADEAKATRALLAQCEQVAYLTPPVRPEAVAGIRLMGGEFCGNAAMGTAAWLVKGELKPGDERTFLLEVSGAANPVQCTVRKTEDGFEGTVEMPGIPQIGEETLCGIPFTAVRLEGITHLICDDRTFEKKEAEKLLGEIAGQLPDEAIGLIQWDRVNQYMLPLVFVRGSGSMVWEQGCGSGSAAVGASEALRNGSGETAIRVRQPGGTILATAAAENGRILSVRIAGRVRIVTETDIGIS